MEKTPAHETFYREATPDDAERICEFQLRMAEETEGLHLNWETCMKGVQAVFQDPSKGQYFVAESNGQVVASLLITYEWSDWRNGNIWWIQSVYVLPELRRKGIFSKFYSFIQDIVHRDESIRGLRLYVERKNERAKKVYCSVGMDGEHYELFEWLKP